MQSQNAALVWYSDSVQVNVFSDPIISIMAENQLEVSADDKVQIVLNL